MKRISFALFILISTQPIEAMEFLNYFQNAYSELSLFRAAVKNDIPEVRRLLEQGVNPNSATFGKATGLGWAAHYNHKEVVNLLIQAGANVDASDSGKTALVYAAHQGNLEICESLLIAGANPNAHSHRSEWSALIFATVRGHTNICRLLIHAGANVRHVTGEWNDSNSSASNDDYRRLLCAPRPAQEPKIKRLLPFLGTADALTIAIGWHNKEITKIFLDAGAHVSCNQFGFSRIYHIVQNWPSLLKHICFAPGKNMVADSKKTVLHLLWCFKQLQPQFPKDIQRFLLAYAMPDHIGNLMILQRLQGKPIPLMFIKNTQDALYASTMAQLRIEFQSARQIGLDKHSTPLRIEFNAVKEQLGAQILETCNERLKREKFVCNN